MQHMNQFTLLNQLTNCTSYLYQKHAFLKKTHGINRQDTGGLNHKSSIYFFGTAILWLNVRFCYTLTYITTYR